MTTVTEPAPPRECLDILKCLPHALVAVPGLKLAHPWSVNHHAAPGKHDHLARSGRVPPAIIALTHRLHAKCLSSGERVDDRGFPTPEEPINAAVSPCAQYFPRASRPLPSRALTKYTGTPKATFSTSAARASASRHRSALLSNTAGRAPLSQATARYRSMRRRFNSRLSELTINTTSRFVATICSPCTRPATLRESLLLRGKIHSMRARPSSGRGAKATQSPTTGRSSRSSAW